MKRNNYIAIFLAFTFIYMLTNNAWSWNGQLYVVADGEAVCEDASFVGDVFGQHNGVQQSTKWEGYQTYTFLFNFLNSGTAYGWVWTENDSDPPSQCTGFHENTWASPPVSELIYVYPHVQLN